MWMYNFWCVFQHYQAPCILSDSFAIELHEMLLFTISLRRWLAQVHDRLYLKKTLIDWVAVVICGRIRMEIIAIVQQPWNTE